MYPIIVWEHPKGTYVLVTSQEVIGYGVDYPTAVKLCESVGVPVDALDTPETDPLIYRATLLSAYAQSIRNLELDTAEFADAVADTDASRAASIDTLFRNQAKLMEEIVYNRRLIELVGLRRDWDLLVAERQKPFKLAWERDAVLVGLQRSEIGQRIQALESELAQ